MTSKTAVVWLVAFAILALPLSAVWWTQRGQDAAGYLKQSVGPTTVVVDRGLVNTSAHGLGAWSTPTDALTLQTTQGYRYFAFVPDQISRTQFLNTKPGDTIPNPRYGRGMEGFDNVMWAELSLLYVLLPAAGISLVIAMIYGAARNTVDSEV